MPNQILLSGLSSRPWRLLIPDMSAGGPVTRSSLTVITLWLSALNVDLLAAAHFATRSSSNSRSQ